MRPRVALASALFLLLSSLTVMAQGRGSARGRSTPRTEIPTPDLATQVFLTGRAVLQDGSPPPQQVAIQTICKGRKHTETYTDSHGNFSFQFGPRTSAINNGNDGRFQDAETSAADASFRRSRLGDYNDCEIQASLGGYVSDSVPLQSRLVTSQSGDLGLIRLHKMSRTEGLTVSATTEAAPGSAKKAFDKGREREQQQEWQKARAEFEKAVAKYPRFAVAWFELGLVAQQMGDAAAAQHAWEQAVQADDKFIKPYFGLAALALHDQHWDELARVTERILNLDAVSYPAVWFEQAAAHYYLKNFDSAEKSALQGLRVDEHHQVSKLEFLLGAILIQKHQYNAASAHIRKYLETATLAADIDAAKQKLQEISQLSGAEAAHR